MLRLWKYGRITGLWRVVRAVTPETADAWLARFREDEPDETFVVSKRKPSRPPVSAPVPDEFDTGMLDALMPGIDREIDRGGGWAQIKNLPGGRDAIYELVRRGVLEEDGDFVRRPPVLRGLGLWEP